MIFYDKSHSVTSIFMEKEPVLCANLTITEVQ